MRWLVTGASGQLGGYVLRELAADREPVVAWGGSPRGPLFGVDDEGEAVVNPLVPTVLQQFQDKPELTCYAALLEGLTGVWNAAVRAAVVTRLRAAGLPQDDLLLRLQALSPTLGFAAETGEWAREWLADPFTQDALLVQQCVVRMLLALRTLAEARATELTTNEG